MKKFDEGCMELVSRIHPTLGRREIGKLAEELHSRASKASENLGRYDKALADAASDIGREAVMAAAAAERNTALSILKKSNLIADATKRGPKHYFTDFFAALDGSLSAAEGSRMSAGAIGKTLHDKYMGGFIHDLEKEGLLKVYRSRALQREIARELWELPKGTPGVSKSKEAAAIARIINKWQMTAVQRLNDAGAWIRELRGYIVRQSHDVGRIRSAGFKEWYATVAPAIDIKRTFGNAPAHDSWDLAVALKNIYDDLVTGQALKRVPNDDVLGYSFKGPGNIAKKESAHREIHFTSADAWMDYNESFGSGDLNESVMQGFERAARNVGVMERFGPVPDATFEAVRDHLTALSADNPKVVERLRGKKLDTVWAAISGHDAHTVNHLGATISGGIRAVISMAKLGLATISSITDLGTVASALRFHGKGFLEAWGDTTTAFLGTLPEDMKKGVLQRMGVGIETMLGSVASRLTAHDSTPGVMSKMMRRFFVLNGLAPWTDNLKRGVAAIMMYDLADARVKGWRALDAKMRRNLAMYGLDERGWDLMRAFPETLEDGRAYVTPESIAAIPDERIAAALGGTPNEHEIRRFRTGLEESLRAYVTDQVDFAVITPGARERGLMMRGTQPGTVTGEALRFFMQFKAFPIAMLTKGLGRDIYSKGAESVSEALFKGRGDMSALAHTIIATTVLGYLATSIKDLLKGRNPRPPNEPETWGAAFLQGGGLGIYGDFLLGEYSRFGGRSFVSSAVGPGISTLDDLADLYTRARKGDDFGPQLFQFAKNNTPFINLFYTRTALDYLILYHIQENMSPGYLRRMEKRIERENEQTFWLPPSRYAIQ